MSLDEDKVCPVCGTRYHAAATFCQKDGTSLMGSAAEQDPLIGQVLLEQFRIEEVIGAGGMGTVYRAHQSNIRRDVAIKVLHSELVQNPDAVRRFQREARVATSFDHPNLVRVFLFGQLPDGSLYLVMEYLKGRSLTEVLRAEGQLPPDRALHVSIQICDGIGDAHARGVVHRDVKPENVLLVKRGADPDFVKVVDFGIARLLWDENTHATQSGVIFGTARYISPEGAAGEHTDMRSDVYSIGVLTYQLLCGETPFSAPSPVAMLMKHIHQPAPDIRTRARGGAIPGPIADVVMRALAKNPDARQESSGALAEELRAAAARSGVDLSPFRFAATTQPPSRPSMPAHTSGVTHAERPRANLSTAPAHGTTPPTYHPPAPPPHHTGPYSEPSITGLPGGRRRLGTVGTVLMAFLLGAGAVSVGAYVVYRATGGVAEDEVVALENRAREALRRGAYDEPPGENVRDLTARILEREPGHEGVLALRREAVLALRERAAGARGRGDLPTAEQDYLRALELVPGDTSVRSALEELREQRRAAAAPAPQPALRASPAEPQVREAVSVVAILPDVQVGEGARFTVWRGRRRALTLPAVRGPDEHSYVTSHTFRRIGSYEVRFEPHPGEAALRLDLTVTRRRARRPVAQAQPTTTQQGSDPPDAGVNRPTMVAVPASNDGIDWGVPPIGPAVENPEPAPFVPPPAPVEPTPVEPPPPVEPPAPWTGSGRVL